MSVNLRKDGMPGDFVELGHLPAVVGTALVPEVGVDGGEDVEGIRVAFAKDLRRQQSVGDNALSAGADVLPHAVDEDDLKLSPNVSGLFGRSFVPRVIRKKNK